MTDTRTTLEPPTIEKKKDWAQIKQNRDLLEIATFRNENPDTPYKEEVDELYETLKNLEWEGMKHNPSRYNKQFLTGVLSQGVYSFKELEDAGLITESSWKALQLERDFLPDMTEFQSTSREIQSDPKGTDVYFFGMPTSGKTALLMGIAAANGQGFIVDMRNYGGPYAAALRQFVQVGLTPGRTHGKFVTTIRGAVTKTSRRGRIRNHPINLVEMSGEEFTLRIAETKEPQIANMGTGATNLLRNDNRKIFFIIVDASKPRVKVSYLDHEIDEVGEITQRVRTRYISQLDILDKFVSLISLPENQEIMSKVDAIHFIVTKADTIHDEDNNREENAEDLINKQYLNVIEQLKNYCRHSRHINRSTRYEPQIFTYSLGKFYVGDVFEYDSADTLKVIDAIRESSTSGARSFWQRIKDMFRLI